MKIPLAHFSNKQSFENYTQEFAKVNTKDAGNANAHAKKTAKLSGYDLSVSDINSDGKINMQDVSLMNAHAKNTKTL